MCEILKKGVFLVFFIYFLSQFEPASAAEDQIS